MIWLFGFRICWDNMQAATGPRHQGTRGRNCVKTWANAYAVENTVATNHLSSDPNLMKDAWDILVELVLQTRQVSSHLCRDRSGYGPIQWDYNAMPYLIGIFPPEWSLTVDELMWNKGQCKYINHFTLESFLQFRGLAQNRWLTGLLHYQQYKIVHRMQPCRHVILQNKYDIAKTPISVGWLNPTQRQQHVIDIVNICSHMAQRPRKINCIKSCAVWTGGTWKNGAHPESHACQTHPAGMTTGTPAQRTGVP